VTPPGAVALVTGGTGFVGRVLCAQLQLAGARVRVVARHAGPGPWEQVVTTDLAQAGLPLSALDGVDTVFHLAAEAHARAPAPDDPEHRVVTVGGTRRVLEAAGEAGVRRLVFMSSVKAMGEGGERRLDEGCQPRPDSEYGRAKLEAEELVLGAGQRSGMHTAVLRPPLVYGPGWKGNLARMFRSVAAGRFPPLPDTGNRRSMVHVADVAAAAVLAAERPEADGRVYLVCDGAGYSTRRVYEAMCAAAGRAVPRWHVPLGALRAAARVGDVAARVARRRAPFDSEALERLVGSAWYDPTRAQRELGWAPRWTFEEALPEIVAHARPLGLEAVAAEGRQRWSAGD
jgi:UDP-glucose 4-epimerase